MLSERDYNSRVEKARKAREKQIARNLAKLNDPEYKNQQIAKSKAAKIKAIEKQKEKLNDPEFKAIQFEKAKQAAQRRSQKALEKLESGSYTRKVKYSTGKQIKSRSIKGRAPTSEEQRIGNLIASLGCICCRNSGYYVPGEEDVVFMVSLHHIVGRVKKYSHMKVLPLCGYHHQVFPARGENLPKDVFPIHGGGKKLWVEVNGTEEELLKQVYELIGEEMPWLNEE